MKKNVSIWLIMLALIVVSSVVAIAADFEVLRADTHFDSYYTSASPAGNGQVKFLFYTQATRTASEVGVTSYDVYEKAPGESWTCVAAGLSGSTATNVVAHSFTKHYAGTPGYQYYCVVRHYVKLDGVGKTITYSSNTTTAN